MYPYLFCSFTINVLLSPSQTFTHTGANIQTWTNTHLTYSEATCCIPEIHHMTRHTHSELLYIFNKFFFHSLEWCAVVSPLTDTTLKHPGNAAALSKLSLPHCTNKGWPHHVIPPGQLPNYRWLCYWFLSCDCGSWLYRDWLCDSLFWILTSISTSDSGHRTRGATIQF